jgi:hypothetical protein
LRDMTEPSCSSQAGSLARGAACRNDPDQIGDILPWA